MMLTKVYHYIHPTGDTPKPLNGHGLMFGLGILVLGLVYAPTWYQLFHKYLTSGTYAHGFLIFPLSFWMIAQKREYFKQSPPTYQPWALVALMALSCAWVIANIAYVGIIQQLCVILMVISLFVLCFGTTLSLKFSFPLLYLLFAIPFGNFLTPTLQDLTAEFSVKALEWSNVPVFYEGWKISTTTGDFEVAEACSGIRYLIATLALGLLYAYMTYDKPLKRIIFCLACLLVPLLANGIRAYLIIMIAHKSNMKYAVGVDHLIYGWIFFGFIIFVLFFIGAYWRDEPKPLQVVSQPSLPKVTFQQHARWLLSFTLAISLVPVMIKVAQTSQGPIPNNPIVYPEHIHWKGPNPVAKQWTVEFFGPSYEQYAMYSLGDSQVEAYLGVYYQQSLNNELISEKNQFYPKKKWSLLGSQTLEATPERPFKVTEFNLQRGSTKRLVWYTYVINDTKTVSPVYGKMLEAYAYLTFSRRPAGVVVLSSEYDYFPSTARKTLESFVKDFQNPLVKQVFDEPS